MAMEAGRIYIRVGADTGDFDRKMRRVEARSRSTGSVMKSALGIGAAAAVVGGFKAIIGAAGDYEQSLNTFQAVSKANARQMADVSKLAKQLGRDITLPATSAKDAALAMTELAKGGLTVKDSMAAAKGVLQLSAAAQVDVGEAAKVTAKALNAFGLSGKDATRVADVLANAASKSTGEISDFALGLQQSSAVAKSWGLSLNENTAALMQLAQAGVVGSDAGTSFKQMLQSLNATTKPARAQMEALGVSVFDASGKFVGMRSVIEQFTKGLAGATEEQQKTALKVIFGSDAVRAANILLTEGVGAYDKYVKATQQQGAAADLAKAKMKGFNGAMESFKSSVETLAITVGEKLLPILTPAIRRAAEWVGGLEQNEQAMGKVKAIVETTSSVVATFADWVKKGATAADTLARAVGGWENALKLVLALGIVSKVSKMTTGFGLLAGVEGKTGIGLVLAQLTRLKNIGPIAIAVGLEVAINQQSTRDKVDSFFEGLKPGFVKDGDKWLRDHGLGFLTTGGGKSGGTAGAGATPNPFGIGGSLLGGYKASLAPGADRPGMPTSPALMSFANNVARVAGSNIAVTTGTNHNQFVKGTSRQSEHWSGNAGDIAASGARLVALGQAALIAAGADPAWARKQTGGLFNINGYQIIFNTNEGGNHFDHLHVGVGRAQKLSMPTPAKDIIAPSAAGDAPGTYAARLAAIQAKAPSSSKSKATAAASKAAAALHDRLEKMSVPVGLLRSFGSATRGTAATAFANADAAFFERASAAASRITQVDRKSPLGGGVLGAYGMASRADVAKANLPGRQRGQAQSLAGTILGLLGGVDPSTAVTSTDSLGRETTTTAGGAAAIATKLLGDLTRATTPDQVRKALSGLEAMKPIVAQILGKSRDAARQKADEIMNALKATVEGKRGAVATAFETVADKAMRAFDAKTSALIKGIQDRYGAETDAEKKLREFREQRTREQRQQDRDAANLIEDAGERAARLRELDLQDQEQSLEAAAAASREAANKDMAAEVERTQQERDAIKERFAARLQAVIAGWNDESKTSAQKLGELNALLGSSEWQTDFNNTGALLGAQFGEGFKTSLDEIQRRLNELAAAEDALRKRTGTPGAGTGGSIGFGGSGAQPSGSNSVAAILGRIAIANHGFGLGGPQGFAEGGIVKGGRGGVLGLVGEGSRNELITPLPAGGIGALGGTYVTVIVNGNVQTERDLVNAILDGMAAQSRRGGALFSRTPGVTV